MEGIEQRINKFVEQWEYYCYPDKMDKCKEPVEQILKEIDLLQEQTADASKKEKAKLLYLRGKILDLLPIYQKSAQEFLNKSIKLNPANGDCWNTLAHVLFKKRDLEGAQKAIQMALETKGKNKVSLRYQAILLRAQGKSQQQRRRNIELSLKISKDALMLDMKDPSTWYFLANFKKFDELESAVKAYNEAQKHFSCKYPDLYINRANVESYMEDYEAAFKDFLDAHQIDKTAGCDENIKVIQKRMEFTKQFFDRTGEFKKSKFEELVNNIPNKINNNKDGLQLISIKQLKERYNPKRLLSGKIVNKMTAASQIPASYLAMDYQGTFFCLSVYNANTKIDQKLQKDTLIYVIDPELKKVTYQNFTYNSVQVFELFKLSAGGKYLTKDEFNPNEVVTKTFEK